MSVDLTLGPRPDEPGPPVGGPGSYPPAVTARLAADAAVIIARYPQPGSALLPLLHLVQSEDGYLTAAGITFCADQLGLTAAEVTAVATFYSMYRRIPTGDYLVGVCTNTLCAVLGGDAILDTLQNELGVQPGQTTGDGTITLEHVECNAACDYAPVVMVNWEFFDNQTPATARELVAALRSGKTVAPSRGAPLCTFRQTARVLAGLEDPAPDDTGPGAPTLAGLRVSSEHSRRESASSRPQDSALDGDQPC